jgi:hypothetical protein
VKRSRRGGAVNPRGSDWEDRKRGREDGGRKGTDRERIEREGAARGEEGVDWVWSESYGGSDRAKKKVSTRGSSSGSSLERGRGIRAN